MTCVGVCVFTCAREMVPNSCLLSISKVVVLAAPNLINGVCREERLALSVGGNMMSQWVRLTSRLSSSPACVWVCVHL